MALCLCFTVSFRRLILLKHLYDSLFVCHIASVIRCWYLLLPRLSSDTQMTSKHNSWRLTLIGQKSTSLPSHWSETSLLRFLEASFKPVIQHIVSYWSFMILLRFHILSYFCIGYSVWWLTFWNKTKMLTEFHKIR